MAVIHQTTLTPGKLELLTAWLPDQPWYLGTGRRPELTRAGGFRLDDPAGEVGIEFMVVADGASVVYQLPLTYRGSPLAGADGALIGTAEHGVLGRRWVYDGVRDPVLVARLIACVQGEAEPQAQNVTDTPDPTVTVSPLPGVRLTAAGFAVEANGPSGTDLRVRAAGTQDPPARLTLRVARVLGPGGTAPAQAGHPCVSATWLLPDGTRTRGVFVTVPGRGVTGAGHGGADVSQPG